MYAAPEERWGDLRGADRGRHRGTGPADQLALSGLSRFLAWVDNFRREGMVHAELLGALPTFYDRRQAADRDGLRVLHNTELPLFEPVPRRTAVERVVASRIAGQEGEDPEELDRAYEVVARAVLQAARARAGLM
jgi:hypothetical protein